MRALILLFGLFATACASNANQWASREDCGVQDSLQEGDLLGSSWVEVRMRHATWSRSSAAATVHLDYGFNLDPDSMAERRVYAGLSDHARLRVYFRQYPWPAPSDPHTVEVQGEGLTMTRSRERGEAVFNGTDLDLILGGANDIDILLRDSQGKIVRRDRITRSELNQVDALIRRLSARLPDSLADPARFCPPDEIVI